MTYRTLSRLSHLSNFSLMNSQSYLGSLADSSAATLPSERFSCGINENMLCCLCNMVSPDPVYLLCCHNKFYCYKCITSDRPKDCPMIVCPSCTVPVNAKTLTRNDNLRKTIRSLKTVKCEFSSSGCAILCTIETIDDHVDICAYQPSPCENSGCEKICLLKDWTWHCKVICPKRSIKCSASCNSFITADEIDTHDCENVLEDFKLYQLSELEVLCSLFKEELTEKGELKNTKAVAFSDQQEQKNLKSLLDSFSALKYKILMNADDEVHDSLGQSVHHGSWRCSVLNCKIPHENHDFKKSFSDGNRHIFFWDCCLSNKNKTLNCEKI